MSKKRTKYSAEFKSKLVLELLKNERTLSEIASDNNITPQNLQGWKKIFLDNAVIAMEPSKVVKEYKDDLAKSQEENEMLMTLIGKVTIEKEWLEKKLKSLASSEKRAMIEPKLNALSLRLQCQLLGLNRSRIYYQKRDKYEENSNTRTDNKLFLRKCQFTVQPKCINSSYKTILR
ncbi:MAG: transposase [Gammaproteobacteria bacterium]|nr:transposase [Gammaproteobacteria bacterium]